MFGWYAMTGRPTRRYSTCSNYCSACLCLNTLDAGFAPCVGLMVVVACLHTPQWHVAVELLMVGMVGMYIRRGHALPSNIPFPFLFPAPHVLCCHTAGDVGNKRED